MEKKIMIARLVMDKERKLRFIFSSMIAETLDPPYYAVIFTSVRTDVDEGYNNVASRMMDLAAQQEGFLGVESVRADIGITVSYWRDKESIRAWKMNLEHASARTKGRNLWYQRFKVRIAKIERDYEFTME